MKGAALGLKKEKEKKSGLKRGVILDYGFMDVELMKGEVYSP